jgi:hypothetical protein
LTPIFTLADATKLQENFRLSKDLNWADCVEFILKDYVVSSIKIF